MRVQYLNDTAYSLGQRQENANQCNIQYVCVRAFVHPLPRPRAMRSCTALPYGMSASALPQLQRRRDSAREDHGAAQAREEARGLAWLVTV